MKHWTETLDSLVSELLIATPPGLLLHLHLLVLEHFDKCRSSAADKRVATDDRYYIPARYFESMDVISNINT